MMSGICVRKRPCSTVVGETTRCDPDDVSKGYGVSDVQFRSTVEIGAVR